MASGFTKAYRSFSLWVLGREGLLRKALNEPAAGEEGPTLGHVPLYFCFPVPKAQGPDPTLSLLKEEGHSATLRSIM